MKAKLSLLIFLGCFLSACKKDQFTTKPQLTFQSVNTQVLNRFESITFILEYTDKEGDIQDSLYVEKTTINCSASNSVDYYQMPVDVPETKNSKGDIEVSYSYGLNLTYPAIKEPACLANDTCFFKFVLKDKAGNISDTAISPQIVIVKS